MELVRSVLYLPASNPRAIEKARGLTCDAVILDLEDAIAPASKAEARRAAVRRGEEQHHPGKIGRLDPSRRIGVGHVLAVLLGV